MAGGNHDAADRAHRPGQVGDGRRRHRADREDIHPHAQKPARDRVFKHIARNAGVFAEHDALMTGTAAEHLRRRLADKHRDLRRNRVLVGLAADSVRSE